MCKRCRQDCSGERIILTDCVRCADLKSTVSIHKKEASGGLEPDERASTRSSLTPVNALSPEACCLEDERL
jgi:hypothetical protein